jgi:hypothetical protein
MRSEPRFIKKCKSGQYEEAVAEKLERLRQRSIEITVT